jgi:hypothetical protein
MNNWSDFLGGFAVGVFATSALVFVLDAFLETPEQKHTRMVKELEYVLPVLRAMEGCEK